MPNMPDFFGHQYVMNTDDEVQDEETRMLIGATDLDLAECTAAIRARGGIAVPAHINRGSNGLLVNLGIFPFEPEFPVVEVAPELPIREKLLSGREVLHSSDAHQLGAILEPVFDLKTDQISLCGILEKFNKQFIVNK